MTITDRLKHAWNAFTSRDSPNTVMIQERESYQRPDRVRLTRGNERSIINAVYNRIAVDCSEIKMEHVRLDDQKRYIETIDSPLNDCLTLAANKDQTHRAFMRDLVMSMFDEGCVAVLPVDTSTDIRDPNVFKIYSMRTAKITGWYPNHVKLKAYDDRTGERVEKVFPKRSVAIIENPFYSIMNEQNSVLQRLIHKLNILDAIDEQSGAGKLDLIIQLPYIIKSEARKQQADERRRQIEEQLEGSKFGIAYTDGTEKVMQLNRPLENNLMSQIEYLTSMLYSQLGITTAVLDGTADEKAMLNYNNRIVRPIMSAIADEFIRKFVSETARSQGQSIQFFNEPFKLVPVSQLADIADKFTRNEIMSSNEMRQVIGLKPSSDPQADQLRNKNLNAGDDQTFANVSENGMPPESDSIDPNTLDKEG